MVRKDDEGDEEEFDEDIEVDLEDEDDDEDDDVDSDEETEVEDEEEDAADDPESVEIEDETSPDYDAGMAGLAADVPVHVVAVLGKRSFSMQDLLKFHVGQIVDLYRPANETVDLVVGGKLIAKGELVSIDGKMGVKIVKLI